MDTAFTGIDDYEHTWVVKDGTWSVRYYDVDTPGEVVTYDAYVYTITGNKLELARALAPDTVVETFIKQ